MVEAASSRSVRPRATRPASASEPYRPEATAPLRRRIARLASRVSVAIALCALGEARLAHATTVIAKDFRQLCREADLVFVGTVVDVRSEWSDERKQAIETRVVFSDLLALLGVDGGEVELRFGGGEMEGIREEIAGVPRFAVGERMVIFARSERSVSPIVGFHQGCFTVVEGPRGPAVLGSERRPVTSVSGAAVRLGAASAGLESALTLDAFLDGVRRELAARGTPAR